MADINFKVDGLSEVKFAKGDAVMVEGTKSNRVYLLKAGTVGVTAGGTEICKISQPLSIFGEIGALLDCAHSATVKTTEECTFYVIESLPAYCKANPESGIRIAEVLAQRLVNMNSHFVEFKNEITALGALEKDLAFAKQISKLILRMDKFWGREIIETKPRQK